ncbi:hypothetical protein [Bacillus pseudomycoides]|uniref:hypothetical protein n=1 Tax=Bacillus pseudomycoides TaxID=64104 RepID=UPI000BF5E38C|nr:hypothetical protein [Bacillus pseudomycoides]PGC53780.1 hypothetical protein COM14_02225 [Bacillus pseudomycoides]PGD28084.1 hypothetical protein COM30_21050 [Bacillus pseudomycoides]
MTDEKVRSIKMTSETEEKLSYLCSYYTNKNRVGKKYSEDDIIKHLIDVKHLQLKLEEKFIPNPFV